MHYHDYSLCWNGISHGLKVSLKTQVAIYRGMYTHYTIKHAKDLVFTGTIMAETQFQKWCGGCWHLIMTKIWNELQEYHATKKKDHLKSQRELLAKQQKITRLLVFISAPSESVRGTCSVSASFLSQQWLKGNTCFLIPHQWCTGHDILCVQCASAIVAISGIATVCYTMPGTAYSECNV